MKTRHPRGISRAAAEQLLDRRVVADDPATDQLARVLAAASAPARDGELAGEQMAMAAFEANHLATSVTPQKEHTSMLAKVFTAKILLSSLAAFATGGVALAAGTGALTGPHHSSTVTSPTSASATPTASAEPSLTPGTTPSPTPSATATKAAAPQPTGTSSSSSTPSATPSSTATAASLPTTATGLCMALAGDAGSTLSSTGLVQALSKTSVLQTLSSNPEFSSLISTAGSATNVTDYCALLLNLPQLPDPSQLAQLPGTVLGQLLPALPASALATDLSSLPASTLAQVLTAVPASALSTMLTELPSSVVSQLLAELPTSVLTQLLNELPSSILSQVLAELPSSLLSQLPTSLLGQL